MGQAPCRPHRTSRRLPKEKEVGKGVKRAMKVKRRRESKKEVEGEEPHQSGRGERGRTNERKKEKRKK